MADEPGRKAEPWWAVARSEEITNVKPLGIDIGDQPIVLWRDAAGAARALEDRCPHRRAPLSLGCVLPNGMIQCGYHGWTYEGGTGRLKDIPNLKRDAKFPPHYRAEPFAVAESGGFVRVCLDARAPAPARKDDLYPLSGTENVALGHEHYIAALFDDPALLIAIRGVSFTPYLMAELAEKDGKLVMERSCQWSTPHWPSPFSSEFPITLRISTHPVTGESELLLRDDAFRPLLFATLAPVPAARGVTQVRWRAKLAPRRHGWTANLLLGAGAPFKVLPAVDGSALRTLRPSASIQAETLRQAIAGAAHPSAA